MIRRVKSHHVVAFASIMVGLSFLFERYVLLSAALIGPVALLDWIPGPLSAIQVWGFFFVVGSIGILISWTPLVRSIFLVFGAASWAIFAATSLYQSLVGPNASTTGSLLGIILVFFVLRFLIAIRDVVTDFTSRKSRATLDA